jgi:hypothetical protein
MSEGLTSYASRVVDSHHCRALIEIIESASTNRQRQISGRFGADRSIAEAPRA